MVSKVTQKAPEVIFLETGSDTFETGSDIFMTGNDIYGSEKNLVLPKVAPEMT